MQRHLIYVTGFPQPFVIDPQDRELVRVAITGDGQVTRHHVNVQTPHGSMMVALRAIVALEDRSNQA